jgi:hypothetical protein
MTPNPADLGRVLPGTWRILATSFPLWLSGKRVHPTITYTLLPGEPLVLRDEVGYETWDGRPRHLVGIDRYEPRTGRFVWRGTGALRLLTSRWSVEHLSADGKFAVLSFGRSLFTPAGMDIIGKGSGDRPGPHDLLSTEPLGPAAARLDTLTWL